MNSTLRSRVPAPAVGLLIAMISFIAVAIAAPAVFGQASEQQGDTEGPVTPRVVVATTKVASTTYELVSSEDKHGNPCVGVRHTTKQTGTVLFEGCGAAELVNNQVGFVASGKKNKTLFFGRVDNASETATFTDKGDKKKDEPTIKGSDGKKYVLTEVAGYIPKAEVALQDANGRALGRVDGAVLVDNDDDNMPVHPK